ncbi:MAG: sigma-54-dependent Fis family transcriptional regulator [Deltaproteobacteria bacterium]|nr:sigma-54-dependent Fis family transcriptional regulator [Deltaproteobacteria bacterium]
MLSTEGSRAEFSVLVADDEPIVRRTVFDALVDKGYRAVEASDGSDALTKLATAEFDVVITDLRMPGASGLEVLEKAREARPDCAVIVMTAFGTIPTAIQAVRRGAFQYVTKPFDLQDLVLQVDRACAQRALAAKVDEARNATERLGPSAVVARSAQMKKALAMAHTVASTEASVLVIGETGSGKEIIAREIHRASSRADRDLVAVNCSAIPEALFEAELFGVERGAFTGAAASRDGRFLAAHGSTLFLDEVGDLPLAVQAKLLRVLEDGTVQRLGSNVPIPVNVRIVAATHRDLKAMVAEQRFRDDLYFRLNVVTVHVPALRSRPGDIPELVAHFVESLAVAMGRRAPAVSPAALDALSGYVWPGNVRELKNAIMRALVVSAPDEAIEIRHLPDELALHAGASAQASPEDELRDVPVDAAFLPEAVRPLGDVIAEVEARTLRKAVSATGGNRSEAARLLGISRKQLWQKLKQYGP